MKHRKEKPGRRGDDDYSKEHSDDWIDWYPLPWELLDTYRNHKERMAYHLKGLANFCISEPDVVFYHLDVAEEGFEYRWNKIQSIIKQALFGNGTDDSRKKGKAKQKKVDELREASLLVIKGLAFASGEDVEYYMADDSYLQILVKFLHNGYTEGDEQDNTNLREKQTEKESENKQRHSPAIHAKVMKVVAWILFLCNSPSITKEFLRSCAKYFVEGQEQEELGAEVEEDGTSVFFYQERNRKVIIAALKCWTFLLSTLDDEDIHSVFDFNVLSSVHDLLDDDDDKIRSQAATLIMVILSLDTEYPYLQDVGMDKAKYLTKFSTPRGIPKKDKQLYEGLLAKLEDRETHEEWLVDFSHSRRAIGWFDEINYNLQGWRARVKMNGIFDHLGPKALDAVNHAEYLASLFLSTKMRSEVPQVDTLPGGEKSKLRLVRINRQDHEGKNTRSKKWQKRVNQGPNFLKNRNTLDRTDWDAYNSESKEEAKQANRKMRQNAKALARDL